MQKNLEGSKDEARFMTIKHRKFSSNSRPIIKPQFNSIDEGIVPCNFIMMPALSGSNNNSEEDSSHKLSSSKNQ